MSVRIDSQTVVPIGWVLSGFVAIVTFAVAGTFWISAVNARLSRIEERLGIPAYHAESDLKAESLLTGGGHNRREGEE